MARENWNSRITFLMAAVASAIGLGNIWRFPGVTYQNGGGAFIIPFIVALVTAGIPILALELAIGRKFQKGAPLALKEINPNFEWIGWLGVGTAFCISSYYAIVFAWVICYFVLSFKAPWISGVSTDIFLKDTLQLSSGMFDIGGFNIPVLLALTFAWFLIWYCIRNGVESVGKIVNYVSILPVILLLILIARAVTLPNAIQGIKFLLIPDWSMLLKPQVWAAAYGQVFFSLSILFSIMVAYGSYLPKNSPITKDAIIIASADTVVCLLSSITAFATLGYLSILTNTPISEMNHSGIMFAFVTYPTALAAIPGGKFAVIAFSLLFFAILFMLALGSAFSIVEAIATAICDKFKIDKHKTHSILCLVGFLASLIFATKSGLFWVDVLDHFMNDFNLILIGLIETIAIGWIFGADKMLDIVNENCDLKYGKIWKFSIKYVCPIAFAAISLAYLLANIEKPYGGYPVSQLFVGGWLFVILTFVFSFVMAIVKDVKIQYNNNIIKDEKSYCECRIDD